MCVCVCGFFFFRFSPHTGCPHSDPIHNPVIHQKKKCVTSHTVCITSYDFMWSVCELWFGMQTKQNKKIIIFKSEINIKCDIKY